MKSIDVFNNPGGLSDIVLGVTGRLYTYDPVHGTVTVTQGATTTVVPLQTGLTFVSSTAYGYVIGVNGAYTVNGSPMSEYSAWASGHSATYPLMTSQQTAPQMFTLGGNFYTFDRDANGNYLTVTGNTPDLSRQPVPVLDQRPGLYHQHQRPAQHGCRWRQRLHHDRGQQPVRAQRRAVHHRAQAGLAQWCDDLRPVQHHPGQRRRHRELRLRARHAERPDRRQRHDLSADHLRLYLHHHDGRPAALPSPPSPMPPPSPSATSST